MWAQMAYDLQVLHEDLVYVVECLLEDLTAEARHTINDIISSLQATTAHEISSRPKILADIQAFRVSYRAEGRNAEAVRIRQSIPNTVEFIKNGQTTMAMTHTRWPEKEIVMYSTSNQHCEFRCGFGPHVTLIVVRAVDGDAR